MKRSLLFSVILLLLLNATGNSQTNSTKFEFSFKTAHPEAKKWMKEDFYWSPIDETGPFGSDAGSDAAYGFQKWRIDHPSVSPIIYLKELFDFWNFPPVAWDELDTTKLKTYMSTPAHLDPSTVDQQVEILKKENERPAPGKKKLTDEQIREIVANSQKNMGAAYLTEIDQALIGTAFAQFAIEGKIDLRLKDYAAKAIQREMLPLITRQFDRDQVKVHDDKMNRLLQVVKKMPAISESSSYNPH